MDGSDAAACDSLTELETTRVVVVFNSMRSFAIVLSVALGCSLGACSADDSLPAPQSIDTSTPADDAPLDTGSALDAPSDTIVTDDASPADADACEPDCHYDCFSVLVCVAGTVEQHGGGVVSCCHPTDPPPATGACGRTTRHSCLKGCGSPDVDPRYAACLGVYDAITPPAHSDYEPLLCSEGSPKREGDACDGDEACRPSATADRLKCESSTKQCAVAPRPTAPLGYGRRCGLAPGDVSSSAWIATGKTCATCQVRVDIPCVLQACTTTCVFDEDCPTGSSCVCVPGGSICIATTDRTTDEGLTAWLACP